MQLPFLKPRKASGLIIEKAGENRSEPPKVREELAAVAGDLISAVHAKDADRVAMALEAAWTIMESNESEE